MTKATAIKSARLFHLYSGVFLAPALIFFAITGGLQTFSLHETTRGRSYVPPAILVKLGQLHKKQTLVVPERKSPPPAPAPAPANPPAQSEHKLNPDHLGLHTNQQKHDDLARTDASPTPVPPPAAAVPPPAPAAPVRKQNLYPMKIFFGIVAFGLLASTLTGLYMSYTYTRNKLAITGTLLAGIVIPLLLLLF